MVSAFVVICSLRLPFPLFVSFLAPFSGWWPWSLLCIPWSWILSLLFFCCACPYMRLFLTLVFSSLQPLHPAFWFLLGQRPCGVSFTFAASFGSQFLRDGVALWDESVASVGSFSPFSGSLLGLCTLLPSFVVFLCPFLLLFFSGLLRVFLLFLSLVLYFAMWLLLGVCAMVRCPPLWGLSSAFVCFDLLIVACWAVLMVSYGFPCGFLSYLCTSYLTYITMLLFFFVPCLSA